VQIDPSVIGGMTVAVGDIVIDGSVRHRLDQLRESLIPVSGLTLLVHPSSDNDAS